MTYLWLLPYFHVHELKDLRCIYYSQIQNWEDHQLCTKSRPLWPTFDTRYTFVLKCIYHPSFKFLGWIIKEIQSGREICTSMYTAQIRKYVAMTYFWHITYLYLIYIAPPKLHGPKSVIKGNCLESNLDPLTYFS